MAKYPAMDRFTYYTEAVDTVATGVSTVYAAAATIATQQYGYFAGGGEAFSNLIHKLTFATDTLQGAMSATLAVGRLLAGAVKSSTKAYFCG